MHINMIKLCKEFLKCVLKDGACSSEGDAIA